MCKSIIAERNYSQNAKKNSYENIKKMYSIK